MCDKERVGTFFPDALEQAKQQQQQQYVLYEPGTGRQAGRHLSETALAATLR